MNMKSELCGVHRLARWGLHDCRLEAIDIALPQHPRRVWAELCRVQAPVANPFQDGRRAHLQERRRLVERQLAPMSPLTWSMHVDRVAVPERADAARRPAFPVRRAMSDTVKDGGNHRVWLQARQTADQFDGVGISNETALSGPHFLKAQS